MNEAAREAREEAAERELTGRSPHGGRTVGEASAVLAGLERALTAQVAPQQLRTVSVDERMIVSLTAKLLHRRRRSGRVYSVVWAVASNGGLNPGPRNGWEEPRESRKGGQEP
jgi:hypothetical protein